MRMEILKRISRDANIPGFRPGKAPINLLMKRFRKDTDELTRERVLSDALKLMESEEKDRILLSYSAEEVNESDEGAYEVLFRVVYIPSFELPQYKGIKITKKSEDVTDEEVTAYIAAIAKGYAAYSKEERPATAEDCIVIDFVATVDGKSPSEACGSDLGAIDKGEDYKLERDDAALSVLFGALVGAVAGEERVHEFDLDDSFAIPELRGKHIVFNCKVKEVQSVQIPDVESEEFLRNNNVPDSATLRSTVRKIIEREKKGQNRYNQHQQVFEFIVSQVDFPLPQKMIDMQIDTIVKERNKLEQESKGKTEEEIGTEARQDAVKMLRFFYTACAIAKKEGISATEREIAVEITGMAINEGVKDFRKYFAEMEAGGRIERIRETVVVKKTLDFMVEHADVTLEEGEQQSQP